MPRQTSSLQSPESLEKIAVELQRQAFSLLGIKDAMVDSKCASLRVDSYSSLVEGMKRTERFISASIDAMRDWKAENGSFRADKQKAK